MTNIELEEYFKRDKSDWYQLDETGQKIWDDKKVTKFWKLIRKHKIDKEDFNFNYFVFPILHSESEKYFFFSPKQDRNINTYFTIIKATFLDRVFLKDIKFQKSFTLVGCKFHDTVWFDKCKFTLGFMLNGSVFHESIKYRDCLFSETSKVLINPGTVFQKGIDFNKSIIDGKMYFRRVTFKKNLKFEQIILRGDLQFLNVNISDYISFNYSKISGILKLRESQVKKAEFIRIAFIKEKVEISNIEFDKDSSILFFDCILSENFHFRECDMKQMIFISCDVTKTVFFNCIWNEGMRIKLMNEAYLLKNEELSKLKRFKALENIYRQLKKNFDSNKDWELSGLAYYSEMKMRKNRLFIEKNYYSCFIYWFYGFFGGYTQDIKRPIISLIGLIFVSTLIYYLIDPNLSEAFQRGINGCFPYLRIEQGENAFTGYLLIPRNIQFLLGSIFITFFILALRKRFKL